MAIISNHRVAMKNNLKILQVHVYVLMSIL